MNTDQATDWRSSPLAAVLDYLISQLGTELLDQLWLFPPYTRGEVESTLVLIAAYDAEPERRRVMTAQRSLVRGSEPVQRLVEHGVAPADRIHRMAEGILRRLPMELAAPPRRYVIAGDPAEWEALLAREAVLVSRSE